MNLSLYDVKANQIGYLDWRSQWLFVMMDDANVANPATFMSVVPADENVAFLFNTSDTTNATQNELPCFVSAMLQSYINALHKIIRQEEADYFKLTAKQWLQWKPSDNERVGSVFYLLKVK